jgi:pimeloyl-[acyl-carrier protein] synthase
MDDAMDYASLDPFDPEFYAGMHDRLRVLRDREPVHYIASLQTWCTATYADSELVFRDPRFIKRGWTRMVIDAFGGETLLGNFLFFKDPPEHTRLRRLVRKSFRPATIDALAARAAEVVDELIDNLRQAGGGDLVKDFAWRVPVPVIGSLFGVPAQDSEMIAGWGRDLFLATDMTHPDRLPAGRHALTEMSAYFSAHVEHCRARDEDGFIATLATASVGGDDLDDQELVTMCLQLLIGGYDTTANQIASGIYLLLAHPDQLAHLRADWSLVGNTVEEILRFEPSAPFLGREAAVDIAVGDKTIRAGELIGPLVAAANHDPARFRNPGSFEITHPRPTHLTFGVGSRFCLGERLARLDVTTAIARLFNQGIELTLEEHDPQWRSSLLFRGPESLHVTIA